MKLSAFDYPLPADLIAQHPPAARDRCRLLVLDRRSGSICDRVFADLPALLSPGDLLVLNDTKVIPARLLGRRLTGGKIEIFLIEKRYPVCEALVRPSSRLKDGERVVLESGDEVEILGRGQTGRFVKFLGDVDEIVRRSGHVPLPPYIARSDDPADRDAYQTVYSVKEGATASPTAGLHFTAELIEAVKARGVDVAFVTLHTNYGTFAPVKCDDIEHHRMHKEWFELPAATIEAIRRAKQAGGKVVAVGTTSTRVLESCASLVLSPQAVAQSVCGTTDIYIYPGFEFMVVDGLITNFHMPKSTLMILVSAFAGRDFVLNAYRHAVAEKYRFFSYGDAMLIV